MRNPLPSLLMALLAYTGVVGSAAGQNVMYVSDTQYIPVRSGPGNDYRIINRGLPSGTQLAVSGQSEDGVYSEITTERGTKGWIRSQYLMSEPPAQLRLDSALARAAALETRNDELLDQMASSSDELQQKIVALQAERDELDSRLASTSGDLVTVSNELSALKQVSANAVQLDTDNRRLAEQSEMLKSETETLQAENQRLSDKLDSEAFMNGALAVLMGVGITLGIPYVWPKRKRHSEWA